MKLLRKLINAYYQFLLKITGKDYKIIIILSHTRSGSTLLTNILANHDDIIGYGETFLKYTCYKDFQKLILAVHRGQLLLRLKGKYVLDKILHNEFIESSLLNHPSVYPVFLLRKPENALPSILNLSRKKNPYKKDIDAYNYYIKRLDNLIHHAKNVDKALFITYENMQNKTTNTLKSLKQYLELEEDLLPEYKLHRKTGKRFIGDSSANIYSGKVLKNHQSTGKDVVFDKVLIDKARKKYDECYAFFREKCNE